MMQFPLNVISEFGTAAGYVIYTLLGVMFGFILESAGFGNSRKLAAQFYFQELTVFKVMFTAIIVAMVLLYLAMGLGLLDYQLLWVNPTYLWPGILGGFIMGVGFIIGGFCPGTSLVAAATLKIDGWFFVAGVLFGIFLFGDTVDYYRLFFYSSDYGRITLPDILQLSEGTVVVVVVLMALMLFWGAEWLEKRQWRHNTTPAAPWLKLAASAIAGLALLTIVIGQPTLHDRWGWIAAQEQARIDNREIFASPLEVATLQNDRKLRVNILDIRSQSDFNAFHIRDALQTDLSDLESLAQQLIAEPVNTLNIIAANGESKAIDVWRQLRSASVPNLYVLEGGVNGWIRQFVGTNNGGHWITDNDEDDVMAFQFKQALGERYPMASPNLAAYPKAFTKRVKLEIKRAPAGGGCG